MIKFTRSQAAVAPPEAVGLAPMAPMPNGHAVVAHEVARRYGEGESAVDAIRGVTLEVPTGQFAAVMGPS